MFTPAGDTLHLPRPPTPFIGRADDVDEIARLLLDPARQLLTLVGPGGIGKTRLAIEVARRKGDRFANGAYFVNLQPVHSANLLASSIAEAIGFSFYEQQNPETQLLDYLSVREVLLVLDNFEHLLDGAPLIGDLLQTCPKVQVIVTSREVLNLQQEWVWHVQGMRFPDADHILEIEDYSALKLFIECAQRVQRHFSPQDEQTCMIRICRLLEGTPLAIEIAAGWLKELPCAEIADQIQRNLDFLTTRVRNIPERHRSMRAVFEQSWNLLDPTERDVFKQLAVFRDGFRWEAAGVIAGASLLVLSSLVDKSLLHVDASGRFALHELLRQFAEERLSEKADEQSRAYDRHCDYYADYLYQFQRRDASRGSEQIQFIEQIGAEIENVRAAWNWAVEGKKVDAIAQSFDSLERFYGEIGWYLQAARDFAQAASALASPEPIGEQGRVYGHLLARQAFFCNSTGELERGKQLAQHSLTVLDSLNAANETFYALHATGIRAYAQGLVDEAQAAFERVHTISRQNGDHWSIAMSAGGLGITAQMHGDYPGAIHLIQEGVTLFKVIGDRWGVAWFLHNLSSIYCEIGHYETARQLALESLTLSRESNTQNVLVVSLETYGTVAHALGFYDEAKKHFQDSLHSADETGNHIARVDSLIGLGSVALAQQDYGEAQRLFEQCLTTTRQTPSAYIKARALRGLGRAASGLGGFEQAHHQYEESLALCREIAWQFGIVKVLNDLGTGAVNQNRIPDACKYFGEALEIGTTIGTTPAVLDTIGGAAQLLIVEGEPTRAVEWLRHVLDHPACHADTKTRIKRLLDELVAEEFDTAAPGDSASHLDAIIAAVRVNLAGESIPEKKHSLLIDALSEREVEILRLIADGLSNQEIANHLFLAVGTVKVHTSNIYSKLDVGSRTEAVARATALNLL